MFTKKRNGFAVSVVALVATLAVLALGCVFLRAGGKVYAETDEAPVGATVRVGYGVSGSEFFDSFDEALTVALTKYSPRVTLLDDVTVGETAVIPQSKYISLYLNGFMLEYTGQSGAIFDVSGALYIYERANNDNAGGYVYAAKEHTIVSPVTGGNVAINGGLITGGKGAVKGSVVLGGAFFIDSTGLVHLNEGTVAGNTAVGGGDGGHGGAIRNNGEFKMLGGTISHNKSGCGGGICVCNGTLEITNSTPKIEYNESTADGGGVFFESNDEDKKFSYIGGKINNNIAATPGGGVHLYSGTMEVGVGSYLASAIVSNNEAGTFGGGIAVSGGVLTVGRRAIIEENTAATGGGGISINADVTVTISSARILSNHVTAGWGGGICMTTGSLDVTTADIRDNDARVGGGVYVGDGDFEMTGGTIGGNSAENGNTASESGGGVYVASSGTFTMNGGKISGNGAEKGGGVYIAYGASSAGEFEMIGSTISGNEASVNGGGVYVDGYSTKSTFSVSGAVQITGNKKGDSANNVYLAYTCKITVAGELTGASIGVTGELKVGKDKYSGTFTQGGYNSYNSSGQIGTIFSGDEYEDDSACFSLAGSEVTLDDHRPQRQATCLAKAKCLICANEYGELLAHTEVDIPAVAATCTQTGLSTGKKCSVCNTVTVAQQTVDALGHTGGTASCTVKATCENCGNEYGELLAHTEVNIPAVAATCTQAGLSAGKKCSVCNTVTAAQQTVDALGHTGGTASCTVKATCENCGNEYGELLAHTEVNIPAVAATCTQTGLSAGKKCSVCNTVTVAQQTVAALGHTFGDWVAEIAATATQTGTKAHKDCTVCNKHFDAQGTEITDLVIPATGASATPDPDPTPTPDPTPNPEPDDAEPSAQSDKGLSGGAIAGITIGSILGALAVVYAVGLILYKKGVIGWKICKHIYPYIKRGDNGGGSDGGDDVSADSAEK
ncbi:MAG: hypothetical protein NC184_03055 [Roseburia sp.]|nr:hypothetical protein [Roseburia sp.]